MTEWGFQADDSVWDSNPGGYPHGTRDRDDISYQRPLELPVELRHQLATKGKPSR